VLKNKSKYLFFFVSISISILSLYVESAHTEDGRLYDENKGLHLSSESIDSLGIKLGKVTQKILSTASIPAIAQVFRSANEESTSNKVYLNGYAYASSFLDRQLLEKIKVGDIAYIENPFVQNIEEKATVIQVNPDLIKPLYNTEVIIKIEQSAKNQLSIGSSVKTRFIIDSQSTVITIPQSALLKTAGGYFAYVKDECYFVRKPIVLGIKEANWLEVKEGLSLDEEIVIRGTDQLWITELEVKESSDS